MRARAIAFLVALALMPGAMELVELGVHFAVYGDVADSAHDEHGGVPLGIEEHGCSGTMHLGACHGGQYTIVFAPMSLVAVLRSPQVLGIMPTPESLHGLSDSAPELRPPIV